MMDPKRNDLKKITDFLSGELVTDRSVTPEDLMNLGIRNRKFLNGNILFEPYTSLRSGIADKNGRVFIGAHSYMNDGGYLRGTVAIGRYCSLGRRISLGAGPHPMTNLSTHPSLLTGRSRNVPLEILDEIGARADRRLHATVIANDVWIGDGAVVMPGVHIGTGAVIGANAIVSCDVPPYAIVAGSPGRILRHRFAPKVVEALLASRWWEQPHNLLKKLPLNNIVLLLPLLTNLPPAPPVLHETLILEVVS